MDPTEENTDPKSAANPRGGRHSHWLMIACCIPIVAIAVLLVAFGAPLATLALVIGCAAMMGFMMLVMMRG